MAVFLGQNSSTSAVDASTFPGGVIKPNHIYFTDHDFEDYYYRSRKGGGMDIGVYNMETKTVEPIYTGELLLSKISPSIWITPSPSPGVLEWVKMDDRRFLHAVYRVGDLDKTIKFYTESLGMQLLRRRDIPDENYSNAFLGFGPEQSPFVVELTYNYGVDKYDIGTGFGHFAIATEDVHKLVEDIKAKGVGTVTQELGPVKGGNSVIAFAKDPDGYLFELIQREPTPEPLCQVMLRVGFLLNSPRKKVLVDNADFLINAFQQATT